MKGLREPLGRTDNSNDDRGAEPVRLARVLICIVDGVLRGGAAAGRRNAKKEAVVPEAVVSPWQH